jgi:Right handed beta helix region
MIAGFVPACGGSIGKKGAGEGTVGSLPTVRPTSTPRPSSTPVASVTPTRPAGTGTPTPSPTAFEPTEAPTPAEVFVFPGASIAAAAKRVPDGGIVVVAPGAYGAVILEPGDLQGSVTLFADVTGEFTDSAAAPVTIVARSDDETAFAAFGQTDLAIDGFTLRGGRNAGFLCTGCSGVTILDSTVTRSGGDAVRFEASEDSLVFNNLLVDNQGAGVRALGTTNLQIVSNTIYQSSGGGIVLSRSGSRASSDAFLRNNIVNNTDPRGIVVDLGPPSSLVGFDADFNLNTDGYSGTAPPPNDFSANPLFISAATGDFHVAPSSPAVGGGSDDIDPDLAGILEELSTQTDGSFDTPPLDLGFHYNPPIPTPTRTAKPTRTRTPTVTPTP